MTRQLTNAMQLYLVHWPVAFAPGDGLFPTKPGGDECVLDEKTTVVDTWKGTSELT